MNAAEAVRRIYRELQQWKKYGDAPEVLWTIRGLDIAFNLVHELALEERRRKIEKRPRYSRWLASDLAVAVRNALNALKRAERTNALKILERAHDMILESRPDLSPKK